MLALIPYFTIPLIELGPIVLDSWAILVSLGFILGLEVARSRGIRLGLEVKDVVDGALVVVGSGFVVAHLVHVLAYNPHQLREQGVMALLKLWAGFSSTGGFIGGVLGAVIFYRWVRRRSFWIHGDTMVFGFPFGWVLGRLGCFTAHDHIGRQSDFFLAVDFPGGGRHDLGLYEALLTMLICQVFWLLRKREVKPGLFTALFATLYAPVRFGLEFLRNTDLPGADVRWGGLTPAQYGSLAMFVAGLGMIGWLARRPGPLVGPPLPPPP